MADTAVTMKKEDVAKASAELSRMRRSLAAWIKYRTINDQVAAGKRPSKLPPRLAQQMLITDRDWAGEQKIANQLSILLSEVMPEGQLPNPSITVNPNAAVELARIAIAGATPGAPAPTATGTIEWNTWMWPILIVGGLLLAVMTAIGSYADVQKEKERYACIKAGACTDYGLWLKIGGAIAIGWYAWEHLGVKHHVGKLVKST